MGRIKIEDLSGSRQIGSDEMRKVRGGIAGAGWSSLIAFPDACLSPSAPGMIPIPYPNLSSANDSTGATKKIKMDGGSIVPKSGFLIPSTGDE